MVTVLLLCLSLAAVVVLLVRSRLREAYAHVLPPVHPGGLPFIGHALCLIADTKVVWLLIQRLAENCRVLGGVICAKIGTELFYLITDPEDALTVANTCLQKHYFYSFVKNWLGQGLITGSGDIYKRHRKLLNPGYTASAVHDYLEVFNDQARKLVREMDTHSARGPFDPSPLLRNMALESSCLTTFGSGVEDKNFVQKYMHALDEVLYMMTQRCQKFYLHPDVCYKLFGYHKQQSLLVETLHKMTNEVIQQRKAAMQTGDIHQYNQDVNYKSFLDRLIELSRNGLLTDEEVKEEANTNIAAAFETTSYTLVHIAVMLGTYPKVQEKMYREVMEVLGTDRDVDKHDLQKLVYTKAVIKESLRVIPTVPVILRYIDREVKLKNYTMRANSHCAILTIGMHRHAAWGPDADQFKPERWLNPATLPANSNCFAGFSIGKRACAGMTYSMTLLSVVLAHLVRQYKWTGDVTKMELKLDVTLRPVTGQDICIERRQENEDIQRRRTG